jgi:hypothetical protein
MVAPPRRLNICAFNLIFVSYIGPKKMPQPHFTFLHSRIRLLRSIVIHIKYHSTIIQPYLYFHFPFIIILQNYHYYITTTPPSLLLQHLITTILLLLSYHHLIHHHYHHGFLLHHDHHHTIITITSSPSPSPLSSSHHHHHDYFLHHDHHHTIITITSPSPSPSSSSHHYQHNIHVTTISFISLSSWLKNIKIFFKLNIKNILRETNKSLNI